VERARTTCEVIVVDNASTDGTAAEVRARFAGVTLLCNAENAGYTAAANLGIARSAGRAVLFLNPDLTLPDSFSLDDLMLAADGDPACGVFGCVLLAPDGRVQSRGNRWPSLGRIALSQAGLRGFWSRRGDSAPRLRPVDWVSGAWMLVRRQVFIEIGLFDEAFYMYGEDVEFCLRARRARWHVGVIERLHVVHHHGKAALQNLTPMLLHSARADAALLALVDGRPLTFARKAMLALLLAGGAALRGGVRSLRGDPVGAAFLGAAARIPRALLARGPGDVPRASNVPRLAR
jgi:GT2 family glycosyltransferase